MNANMSIGHDQPETFTYQSRRTHRGEPSAEHDADYAASGDFQVALPGSLEHWLTARYCLYNCNREGHPLRDEIDHPPWSLAPADYTERINTMTQPLGLELTGDPHLLIAKPVDVRAWIVTRCKDE